MLGWQSTQILCFGDYWVFCTQLIFSGKINVYFRFEPKKVARKNDKKKEKEKKIKKHEKKTLKKDVKKMFIA